MHYRWEIAATVVGVAVLILGGCGSSPERSLPGERQDYGVKIEEYVGDGHGGTRPWPALIPQPGGPTGFAAAPGAEPVHTQSLATLLRDNAACIADWVGQAAVNWCAVDPRVGRWVVTLQPTTLDDVDLYVLEGSGADFGDGNAAVYDFSTRTPAVHRDRLRGRYAPDWVAFAQQAETNHPAAFVAVYGLDLDTGQKEFTIEADRAGYLEVDGRSSANSLRARNSRWFYFLGEALVEYEVLLTATEGDPDLYVYGAAPRSTRPAARPAVVLTSRLSPSERPCTTSGSMPTTTAGMWSG